ncbi:hypothetical protein Tco_1111857 [Tanacetum coccineum]|uniref:Integrase, catalytic region, zinc finger, CCHC-type, peptidase aspartic, catalytic n=1 Tax=Tanacetum coccineum TaxID=301880 RepID=A0ABQ5IN61_9ASTR
MANLSEDIQCAGSDTRPPMLDKADFASWQQRIRLYCRGKENGVNILKSIDEGPFQMGTTRVIVAEGTEGPINLGPERPRVYSDLSQDEKDRQFDPLVHWMSNVFTSTLSATQSSTNPPHHIHNHIADTSQFDLETLQMYRVYRIEDGVISTGAGAAWIYGESTEQVGNANRQSRQVVKLLQLQRENHGILEDLAVTVSLLWTGNAIDEDVEDEQAGSRLRLSNVD